MQDWAKSQINGVRSRLSTQATVLIVFSLLTLLGILNHAMWRDELNVWLIVRDSTSWSDYVNNIHYEGHPLLWYLSLSFWHLFTDNPLIMQLWHWVLAIAIVWLFWRYSPFLQWQKICFTFGYFPLYEYALISRNYAIGIVCLFTFCAVFPQRSKCYWLLGLILALMANTNAYACLIAIALALMLGLEILSDRGFQWRNHGWNIMIGASLFLAGLAIAVYIMLPPSDSYLQGGASQWFLIWDWDQLWRSLSRIWSAYNIILIPADSKLLDTRLFGILSSGMMLIVVLRLWRKPLPLFFYLLASSEIIFFTYAKFLGSFRHYGHLWFILLTTLWLAHHYAPNSRPIAVPFVAKAEQWLKRHQHTLLGLFLITQLVGGGIAYIRDWTYPFSASKATAQYLQNNQLDQQFIVGSQDHVMAPLAGYLNRKLYYPERAALGSFTLFNQNRQEVNQAEVLLQTQQILHHKPEVILILNSSLEESTQTTQYLAIAPLEKFERGLIYNEKYYIYRITLAK